jgi:hypothetical protein
MNQIFPYAISIKDFLPNLIAAPVVSALLIFSYYKARGIA